MAVKVSPYPIPELKEFLRPFRPHFYRAESLNTLERYATGLLPMSSARVELALPRRWPAFRILPSIGS